MAAHRAARGDEAAGRPLEPALRAEMEGQFGHRFDAVRIFADDVAADSARILGARAYTLGSDIVFGAGAYAPHTAAGRHVLAHELAHVVQHRDVAGSMPEGRLPVDAPASTAEREADRAADSLAAGRRPAPIETRHTRPVLSRSVGGTVGGGIIGALVGAGTTALMLAPLGPVGIAVGAVLGGIGGLIGGAVIGNLVSTSYRRLTPDERRYAHDIFRDSIDYDKVEITRNSAASAGASRTVGNTINLQDHYFVGDTMTLTPDGLLTLIHEMGHVWQHQNSGNYTYIASSLIPQAVAAGHGSRNLAYDWRKADDARLPWERWNAEQQAECISDYNEALRRSDSGDASLKDINTIVRAEPYIERVRRREGAPGAEKETAPAAAGAGAAP